MTTAEGHRELSLPEGRILYRELGSGPPIVFVHGLLVDSRLWRHVAPALAEGHRCILPELPLGSHTLAMPPEAELTPPRLGRLIADVLAALELEDATIVANDTGGALTQIAAAHHPERMGRIVLTNCDAYDNFLPPAFRPLQWGARVPGFVELIAQSMRLGAIRDLPIAYGMLSKKGLDRELTASWVRPVQRDAGVRRDVRKVLRGIHRRYTNEAAQRLRTFEKPVLLAWGADDRFFKPSFAERLAGDIPTARLELIEDSRTFVPEDQPERLVELVRAFVAEGAQAPAKSPAP
jgi:pimeloyl-ACP methyl ester carboxylesterase